MVKTPSKRNKRRGRHFRDMARRSDREACQRRECERRLIARAQAAFTALASPLMRQHARG